MTVVWFIIGLVVGFTLGAVGLRSHQVSMKELEEKERLIRMWNAIEAEIKKGKVN